MLKNGESIVDLMGGEIDRIEMKLRVSLLTISFINWHPYDFNSF